MTDQPTNNGSQDAEEIINTSVAPASEGVIRTSYEPDKELEAVYACSFCDGAKKCWNQKTDEYEICPCVEKLGQLQSLINKRVVEELTATRADIVSNYSYTGDDEFWALQAIDPRIAELESKQ